MLRVLDLFCGAGGASKGFDDGHNLIVGVDNKAQPHYPYEFIQADASEYPLDGFDIVHASPPCQAFSTMRDLRLAYDSAGMLIHTIERLRASSVTAWSVENVAGVGYPSDHDVVLCAASFGCLTTDGTKLFMARHRKFWSNVPVSVPACMCGHYRQRGWRCAGVYGSSTSNRVGWSRSWKASADQSKALMGIDWMTRRELVQAIPPIYTGHLYRQWQAHGLWQ